MLAFMIGHRKLFMGHFQWRIVAHYQSDVSQSSSEVSGSERGVMCFFEGTFSAKLNSPELEHTLYPQHTGVSTVQNHIEQSLRNFSKRQRIYTANTIKLASQFLEIKRAWGLFIIGLSCFTTKVYSYSKREPTFTFIGKSVQSSKYLTNKWIAVDPWKSLPTSWESELQ